jgi:hypothetical protein
VAIYDVRLVVHGVVYSYRRRRELRVASEDEVLNPEELRGGGCVASPALDQR